MQLRGPPARVSIMTDYRGINSLFNQQTTYPACRLSNKIWRLWPGAPNDSTLLFPDAFALLPGPLPFFRICTILHPVTIARSVHFTPAIFNRRLPLDYSLFESSFPFICLFFSFLFFFFFTSDLKQSRQFLFDGRLGNRDL